MKTKQFTIVLKGAEKGGKLRLDVFINSLDTIIDALRDTERRLTGKTKAEIQYKIVHLSQNSPAKIIIEPILEEKKRERVHIEVDEPITALMSNMVQIRQKKTVPVDMDYLGVEKYVDIGNLRSASLPEIGLAIGRQRVKVDEKFKKNISVAVGEDETENDVIIGRLETINIHRENKFYIYPNVGAKKITCKFPPSLIESVRTALGKRIEVAGTVKYKSWDKYPYAITVTDILKVYPDEKELPEFSSLLGLQEDITGDISSDEFVRALREKEW